MAQNITLLGASYSNVPSVELPKTGGGTALFADPSVTTAVASDVASGKTFLLADGSPAVGTGGGGGADVPVFTINRDEETWEITSITCDKTFAECYELYNNQFVYGAIALDADSSTPVGAQDATSTQMTYVWFSGAMPGVDINYHSDGSITITEPSVYCESLEATANGYYYKQNGGVYAEVRVNVPQPTGTKTISITQNGTTTVDVTNYADAQIAVNVPSSGGSSSWTHILTQDVAVTTTETTAKTAETLQCGSAISTKDKIVWVHIRDKAGKRAGYFYGSDAYFANVQRGNGSTSTNTVQASEYIRVSSSGTYAAANGQYGVWGYSISSAGALIIRRRYSSSNTLTIDGTFQVDVYTLDLPDGLTLFE